MRAVLDDEVVYWQGYPSSHERLEATAKSLVKHLRRHPFAETWMICDRSSGDVIGYRTLAASPDDETVCQVGSALANGWRGRGLGKEELAAVIGLVPHLGFSTIEAGTQFDNERAIALYTKLGFTRTRTGITELPNGYTVKGVWMSLDVPLRQRRCDLR